MSWFESIVISLLQGAFELFPVSSLGHTVLIPALLGWTDWKQSDPNNTTFVAYTVVLHLGTAIALLSFFWRDWLRIIGAVLRSVARRKVAGDADAHLGWLIIAGTIPAGLLGLLFQKPLEKLFSQEVIVAVFLILNGGMLLLGERLRRRAIVPGDAGEPPHRKGIDDMGAKESVAIGTAQALALLPGFSRSGASMVGGLFAGLRHADAARFSFYLATPIILAAAVKKVPDIFAADANVSLAKAAVGILISGITAWLAVRFLLKYSETERLDPFGYYCIAFGIFALTIFGIRAVF